jgi:hypothetical protein
MILIPVTDPDLDAPDGAVVDGWKRSGDRWYRLVVNCRTTRYDVYIGRPSRYGNPYSHLPNTLAKYRVSSRDAAIDAYETWLRSQPVLMARVKRELRAKVLGCFCAPRRCHGDVLVQIANEET